MLVAFVVLQSGGGDQTSVTKKLVRNRDLGFVQ